jgi:putative addiction module component (TIGR02574 family)
VGQLTPEVAKLLEQALALSIEEQEALANSLILTLGREPDEETVDEGVEEAWADEIKRRVGDIRCGETKMIAYDEVRRRRRAGRLSDAGKSAIGEIGFDFKLADGRLRPYAISPQNFSPLPSCDS